MNIQIDLPFNDDFKKVWEEWITYRKEHRFKQYVPSGLKKTFTELKNLSNNNEQTAIKMIERAMSNNWQGFNFKLPNDAKQSTSAQSEQLNGVYSRIRQAFGESQHTNGRHN